MPSRDDDHSELSDDEKMGRIFCSIENSEEAYDELTDWEIKFVKDNIEKKKERDFEYSVKQTAIIDKLYEKLWKADLLEYGQ